MLASIEQRLVQQEERTHSLSMGMKTQSLREEIRLAIQEINRIRDELARVPFEPEVAFLARRADLVLCELFSEWGKMPRPSVAA